MATGPQQANSPRTNSYPASQQADGWERKYPPEGLLQTSHSPVVNPDAVHCSQERHALILPYHYHWRQEKLLWYLEASREPRPTNSHSQAIGRGSFFKHQPHDYTSEERDLPQGHEDHICTVDLLPKDVQRRPEADDNTMLVGNRVECTEELHPSLDISFE